MKKLKVLFVKKTEKGSFEIESIWCSKTENGNYVIDNIPFVADRISLGDTISVELDKEDGRYYFDDFVAVSGNSTIRIYFGDKKIIEQAREELSLLGCETEAFLERNLIAVNVPMKVNYPPIKAYLDKGEATSKWTYEESCLAHSPE